MSSFHELDKIIANFERNKTDAEKKAHDENMKSFKEYEDYLNRPVEVKRKELLEILTEAGKKLYAYRVKVKRDLVYNDADKNEYAKITNLTDDVNFGNAKNTINFLHGKYGDILPPDGIS
jgi:hypothetical protein